MSELELVDEVVTVKQFRGNNWLPTGHDGEYRYTHCAEELVPLVDRQGYHITGLDEESERFFEKTLGMTVGTLSRYNEDFWSTYRIRIPKEGLILNKKNPKDYLTVKVLQAHQRVANSEAEKKDSPFADYVITSSEQEARVESKKVKIRRKAYKIFGGMSTEDMKAYLKVSGSRPGDNASTDFLESSIGKAIETNATEFIRVMEDPDFKMKLFIENCLATGALVKSGSKYTIKGSDTIGHSLDATIEYLKAPENQEVYIALKSKLDI